VARHGGTGALYTIDPLTGQATKAGVNGGCGDIMDLAWHSDGTLFGIVDGSLFRVDALTGTATLVTTLQGISHAMGLAITEDGTFYAADYSSASTVVRVDPATGQTTVVVRTQIANLHGLDTRPAPRLRVQRAAETAKLSWPTWAAAHVLQSAPNLGAGAIWTRIPAMPVTENDRVTASWNSSSPTAFFRLVKP